MLTLFHSLLDNHLQGNPCQKSSCWGIANTATSRRRSPRTGQRRCFAKPASEWITHEDESLRIVPQELWEQVRGRRNEVRRGWPSGMGRRGFSTQQGGGRNFSTHLLSGAMVCGRCGATIADANGNVLGYPVAGNASSAAWTLQSAIYTVPPGAASVVLYAQIYLPTGSTTARFDNGFLTGASGLGTRCTT